MKLAFIGLGRMGAAIAGNLLKTGHHLTVYNRTRGKTDALAKAGAAVADSIGHAVRECDVVFTMLADDASAIEVSLSPDGIAPALPQGAVHVSMSTIGIAAAKELFQAHSHRKQGFVSAPVFGRPDAAEAKRLLVVAAGNPADTSRLRPLFDAVGRQTYIIGSEPWQANLLKLNGNFMIAAMLEAFGEAFATIRKAGVDHHLFCQIMTELFGSPVYKNYGANIANETFEPAGFALKLGLKDVRLGLEAAAELNSPMPFASILRDHFLSAMANGQEHWDWSSLAMVAARQSGLKTKIT